MRCIIIEDEIPAQKILQNYIAKLRDLELVGVFQSALDANHLLRKMDLDLIFMDINLPGISGIQYIKTLVNPPPIIMTTADPGHAVESYELDAICDYLVKPFSFERFLRAINKAKNDLKISVSDTLNERDDTGERNLFVNIDKTLHKINLSDILYIESDKNYVTLVTKNSQLSYIDSLKNWLEKLPESNFGQVHKSYVVNYSEIQKITGNQITIGTSTIPVGRTFKTSLFKKLNLN